MDYYNRQLILYSALGPDQKQQGRAGLEQQFAPGREARVGAAGEAAPVIDGADRLVYVRNADGEWDARKVKVGLSDAGWSQIKEGVAPGDVVSLIRPAAVRPPSVR